MGEDFGVVFEDAHVLAVVKPAGLPTHAAAPGQDNLVSRLQAARGGLKLGVHQRLDAVTSGLLVLSKSPQGAKGLAAQMEGRAVRKTYLAVACGRCPAPAQAADGGRWRWAHWLTRDGDGSRAWRARPARGEAQEAVTEVEVLERCGPLTRLALSPITGRTHQLRAQAAAEGCPLLGDARYGGGEGPGRVMLHAWRLSLRHPVSGEALDLEAPAPPLFGALGAADAPLWGALAARLAAPLDVGPGDDAFVMRCPLPHVRADRFGPWGVLHDLDATAEDVAAPQALVGGWRPLAAAWMGAQGLRGVSLKPHVAHDGARGSRDLPKPTLTLCGPDPEARSFAVTEHGVRYLVDLREQHGCGLYLDQRANRRWVMARVREVLARRGAGAGAGGGEPVTVLNLFAYTCSFSVAAAAAGAERVTSVDVAKRALAWGRGSFVASGLDPGAHAFYADDVGEALARAARRGARFDVVVCDPPSFGRGRKGAALHQAISDLAMASARVVAEGGWLLLCLNHRGTEGGDLRARALKGVAEAGRVARAVELVLPAQDAPPGGTALKSLRVQLD